MPDKSGGPVVSFLKGVFMNKASRYWDLGEEDIITPSQKNLAGILNALILCDGKLHDTHSSEARDGKWAYNTRSCAIVFRISIPVDMEERFKKLSGFKLSEIPQIHLETAKRVHERI